MAVPGSVTSAAMNISSDSVQFISHTFSNIIFLLNCAWLSTVYSLI